MNWKDIIKIIFKGLGYTLAYFMGRGDAVKSIESHCNEEALKEANAVMGKRERIRAKTDMRKKLLTNNWDELLKNLNEK